MRDLPVQSIPRVLGLVAAGARAKSGRIALREKLNIKKTNPIQATADCDNPYCSIALNSFAASVGSKNEANDHGGFLHAVGCLCRDRPEGSRETSGSRAGQQKMQVGQIKAELTFQGRTSQTHKRLRWKKKKKSISRLLAATSLDRRPNSAHVCRQNGASLCTRSYRSTAPSGMGHHTRPSRTPRAPSRRAGTAAPVSGVKLTGLHDHENSTFKRLVAGVGCQYPIGGQSLIHPLYGRG
jgi:hypothetical protein